jgi:hypothetical protein
MPWLGRDSVKDAHAQNLDLPEPAFRRIRVTLAKVCHSAAPHPNHIVYTVKDQREQEQLQPRKQLSFSQFRLPYTIISPGRTPSFRLRLVRRQQVDKSRYSTRRQRPSFGYQHFVIVHPGKCFGKFSPRRTRRKDLGYRRFIHGPKYGDNIIGTYLHRSAPF